MTVVEDRPIVSVNDCLPVLVFYFGENYNTPCSAVSLRQLSILLKTLNDCQAVLVQAGLQSCHQGLSLRGQGQDFFLKANAKDIKKFSRPRQGHIISRPTETATITQLFALQLLRQNYTYLIKHNAKETICDGFGVHSRAACAHRATLIFVSVALSTTLHYEAMNSGLSTFIIHRMPDDQYPAFAGTHCTQRYVRTDGWLLTWA